jgi:hypothetical protein
MPGQPSQNNSTSNAVTNLFSKGLNKDYNESFLGEGVWTHARNAVNNSHDGQKGVLGNEPSNLRCVQLPYTYIGSIPLLGDEWAIFTTDDTSCEIGIFNEAQCSYIKVVNDPGLGFKRTNLITGVYRQTFNCGRKIYWSDALNPDRCMNLDNPPYVQQKVLSGGCYIDTNTSQLDIEALRLAPLLTIPTLGLKKGKGSGTLANGTYQVAIAYTVNEIRVTDYLVLSPEQPLFSHENLSGSLELSVTGTDPEFDEMEVVIISTVNANTVVKRLGIYSTAQSTIYIDTIDNSLPTIPISLIPLRTPAIEKSDSIWGVGSYLLRLGIYPKQELNYQPQANKITTKWVAVKYPADYYLKGGNKASYMRDEQYPFFIRWIYNTGDRTASAHIPGRAPLTDDLALVTNADAIELSYDGSTPQRWQVYNTASVTANTATQTPDGGTIVMEGQMGYWQSSEIYPDDKPEIWGNLCGKHIRHHKFPDNSLVPHFSDNGSTITILGVKFENITHPLDDNGNPITSIVGYEILRGSREGQKTVIAKGIINNMREYTITGNTDMQGLFQNYPYNDLRADSFLTPERQKGDNGAANAHSSKLSGYKKDIFSFHSPETTFNKPFLSAEELKIYGEVSGTAVGRFETPYKHPKFKLTTNADDVIGDIIGVLSALNSFTSGIDIGATEDYPIGLKIGPLPPLPYMPLDFYGVVDSDPAGQIANWATWGVQAIEFAAAAVSLITTIGKFAELEKEKFFSLMRTLIPKVQYGAQYVSHGFYDSYQAAQEGQTRKLITKSNYLTDNLQTFNSKYQVNNIFRGASVIVQTGSEVPDPSTQDQSRKLLSEAGVDLYQNFTTPISSHYVGLKVNLSAQYGQIDSIKQLPIMSGIIRTLPVRNQKFTSDILFGGDTYINRFTEKNSFFYFYDWLFDMPDEFQYDYTLYVNVPYPRFWVNNEQYNRSILKVSSNYRVLDARDSTATYVKKGYFYLFNSGVRDFFVESEVNLALRDWDDSDNKRHYDPYGYSDLTTMFRSDIIKSGNYYKYDYSLSNTRLFNSYISWGNILPRDYDPADAACYSYYPKRIMYSLPQELEQKKDNWKSFLPNNYKDFPSPVTSVKSINRSGALIMMKNDSPVQFMGVDSFQTDAGIKVTVGDGGLFNQPLQSITNSDRMYQYGACQHKYAVTATTYGVFYMSQEAGKIFNFSSGLEEISNYGNKWWFSQYLPSQLLRQFPNYQYYDNPVIGVGCQVIYDNTDDIVYFCKKDYRCTSSEVIYDPVYGFGIPHGTTTVTVSPAWTETVQAAYTETISDAYTELVPSPATCNPPIDMVFVLDITGSMGSTIDNLKTSVVNIAQALSTKSNNDYRVGLITVNEYYNGSMTLSNLVNDDQIAIPLNTSNNLTELQTAVNGLYAEDGGGIPEPTDVALDAAINNTTLHGKNLGTWRSGAVKMIILITDAMPSGNDDYYQVGVDDLRANQLAQQAKAAGIKIYPIATGVAASDASIQALMQNYATVTGGRLYISATGVVDTSIQDAVENIPCPPTSVYHPAVTVYHPAITVDHPAITKVVPILTKIILGDPNYFEDASWTVSYDPKEKQWLSFHDWFPTGVLPGKNHFATVSVDSIWKHNVRTDSYCNFYGVDYPFEVEFVASTGQQVNTVRSVEYILESYKYYNNGQDKFHVLDNNFDRAVVYNSEQVSGMLRLNLKPKNDPVAILQYPKVSGSTIDILYSKEENRYRFNQFWDITKDRGEFSGVEKPMFITKANGYVYQINPAYVNYSKAPTEHKKFRHYSNRVFLRKLVSGELKMILKIHNTKTLLSSR